MYLSICIPSYNRPNELKRLIQSIDCQFYDLEICICEDASPKRIQIREVINSLQKESSFPINYYENSSNLGYDRNLRELILKAKGKWIIFMGDDDVFIPGELQKYINFLKQNETAAYVLRSYENVYLDGSSETFRYFEKDCFFDKGEQAYLTLFRKSTFISGFTFQRELALDTLTERFDSTLLYQLYIVAELTLNYPSAYYSTPFTRAYEGGEFYFGSSEVEKEFFKPNVIDVEGQIYFISSYFKITKFIDEKYKLDSTSQIKREMSKYSYPILAFVRNSGLHTFRQFKKALEEIGLNTSGLFYVYYYSLLFLGTKFTKKIIILIKRILGRTPQL
ncbi:glycosyltransferase family 2 protein [Streptococcus suis]|uniref:glycosyltransferase family 2 protein n=1 Tax=Streptococcus suis TaxID=1307 RepID=UPI003F8927C3